MQMVTSTSEHPWQYEVRASMQQLLRMMLKMMTEMMKTNEPSLDVVAVMKRALVFSNHYCWLDGLRGSDEKVWVEENEM
jgi:hypothetical protein